MTPATLTAYPAAPAREQRRAAQTTAPSTSTAATRSSGASDGDFAHYLITMLRADIDRLGVVAGANWGWTVIVLTVADEVISQAASLSLTDAVRREMRSLVDEARASVRAVRASLRAAGKQAA